MDKKRRRHDDDSSSQLVESSPQRQRVTNTAHRDNRAATTPSNPAFRQQMLAWLNTVKKAVTDQYKKVVASHQIPAADEAENHEPVWYLDCASEYMRRIGMVECLYGGQAGEVISFGSDDASQLGQVQKIYKKKLTEYLPDFVESFRRIPVRHVAAGGLHSIFITLDGDAFSCGSSDEGNLGRDSNDREGDEEGLMQAKPMPIVGFNTLDGENQDRTMVAAAVGDCHSVFLSARGQVYMIGMYKDMDSGKYAHPTTPAGSPVGFRERPVHVLTPKPVIKVVCGHSFTVAILDDETMVTFGMGHHGQLARSKNMTQPDADGKFDLGKSYFYHKAVGDEAPRPNEQLIREQFLAPRPPIFAGGLPSSKMVIVGIAAGGSHLLVAARAPGELTSKLYSSGLNNYGQLGHGDTTDRHELTLVKAVENENIVKLAAGEHYSMALNIHGTVLYSFGRQDYGQLGVDTRKPDENSMPGGSFEPTPQVVVFPGKEPVMIADIACGDRHSLALTTENEVYSWGFGTTGPTGHKTLGDEDIFVPTKLELQPNPKVKQNVLTYQIAGGGQHSLLVVKRYA